MASGNENVGGSGNQQLAIVAKAGATEDSKLQKPKRNNYATACSIVASGTSILLGYDFGVMTGAAMYIQKDMNLTDVQLEILLGIFSLYALLGSLIAGRTSDWLGRRSTIVVAGAIFFVGALLMGFATNYTFLMVGRFVAGVGVGYALMIAPVYSAEVSPASSRGFSTSFPEVFINLGILLGYVSSLGFSKLPLRLGWRFMLGVGAIPSVLLAVSVLAMPESPRWLVLKGRLGDAKRVLDRTSDSKEEAQLRLAEIKEAAGIPHDCNDEIVKVPRHSNKDDAVWKELLIHPTPAIRRVLIAAVGIHFFQQTTGVNVIVLYSPRIFAKAGITTDNGKLLATVAVGVVKTAFILVATFFLDRVGRRRLLLTSVAGMIFMLLTLGVTLTIADHSPQRPPWEVAVCISAVLGFMAFFSIGLGPVTWVYSSEVFPLRLRAQGLSIGVAVNEIVSGVIAMTFLSMLKAMTTGGVFFFFAAIAVVAWFFFFTFLPETRGRTLEAMDELFEDFRWKDHESSFNHVKKSTTTSTLTTLG